MKLSLNAFVGNLVANPQLQPSKDGDDKKDRCWFLLAVNRRWSEDKYDVHPVVTWGALARACAEHLEKGKEATVLGELHSQPRDVLDAQGNPIMGANGKKLVSNYYEISAEYVSFGYLDPKKSQKSAQRASVAAAPSTTEATPAVDMSNAAVQAQIAQMAAAIAADVLKKQAIPTPEAASAPTDDPIPYAE